MQAQKAALIWALVLGCQKPESAQDAIARSRGTLIDQVNEAGAGVPFYTAKTLNPTWDPTQPIVQMPDAEWVDQNAKKHDRSLFLGRTSVVAFMFTSCSGFCPFVVQELKKVAKATSGSNVQYVVFTVDPEFDTPERLKAFAEAHQVDQKNWHFLRGSAVKSLIQDTLASQVMARPIANGRDFVHAGHFYIIDDMARLRGILNGTEISVSTQARNLIQRLPPAL
ncbi:MAG TPA: SCO family protein [Oligoflexus sp.]|uniref:SCO family protein n=1 Tax=Oligoflexus sp. TaxID=1971216 RepID=UPI002D336908|nr:SCO family protein [Oligoflexus sp.]HYX33874.1 SCO family protein [Oligoflexus sp.]